MSVLVWCDILIYCYEKSPQGAISDDERYWLKRDQFQDGHVWLITAIANVESMLNTSAAAEKKQFNANQSCG